MLHALLALYLFGIHSQKSYKALLYQQFSDYASHVAAAKQQSI